MKQPELGKKLATLRKAQGLTQEELVERCSISVRTIQRIETGEVTPRSYTLKTILAALDHDLREILIDETDPSRTIRWLNFAWMAGIAYFLLGFPEGTMDFMRFVEEAPEELIPSFGFDLDTDFNHSFYVLIKVLAILAYVPFFNGFIQLGKVFNRPLLKISSIVLIVVMVFAMGYDAGTLVNPSWSFFFLELGIVETFGILVILFGIGLIQLQSPIGVICVIAGLLEILAGFLTMFFTPFGLLIQMFSQLLEIVILYQSIKLIAKKENAT